MQTLAEPIAAEVGAAGLLNRLRDEPIRVECDRMHPHSRWPVGRTD
jgi:hypothetical protein